MFYFIYRNWKHLFDGRECIKWNRLKRIGKITLFIGRSLFHLKSFFSLVFTVMHSDIAPFPNLRSSLFIPSALTVFLRFLNPYSFLATPTLHKSFTIVKRYLSRSKQAQVPATLYFFEHVEIVRDQNQTDCLAAWVSKQSVFQSHLWKRVFLNTSVTRNRITARVICECTIHVDYAI